MVAGDLARSLFRSDADGGGQLAFCLDALF